MSVLRESTGSKETHILYLRSLYNPLAEQNQQRALREAHDVSNSFRMNALSPSPQLAMMTDAESWRKAALRSVRNEGRARDTEGNELEI